MNFAKVFSPRHNHFHVIRHLAALAVIIDHTYIINGHRHLLGHLGAKTSLGAIGVGVFFVLSGALVTGSYLNCRTAIDFTIRRARRIYPGYAVCIVVTAFLLYPLIELSQSSTSPQLGMLDQQGPLRYVLNNAMIVQWQNRINDLFSSNPEAYSINGSLWSIAWEVGCYFMVLCLGITGILRKLPWLACICLAVAFVNVCLFPAGSIFGKYYLAERITFLPILFLSGTVFYLYREKISHNYYVGIASAILFVVCIFLEWKLAILFLPYAMFGLAYSESEVRTDLPDLSYGMYIYGFPIQQSIWLFCGDRASVAMQLLLGLVAILPVAAASWYWVEKPWLKRKVELKVS